MYMPGNWKRIPNGIRSQRGKNLVKTLKKEMLKGVRFRGNTPRHREERTRWMLHGATLQKMHSVALSPCLGKRFKASPDALYPGADGHGMPLQRHDDPDFTMFIATDELYTFAWGSETVRELPSMDRDREHIPGQWTDYQSLIEWCTEEGFADLTKLMTWYAIRAGLNTSSFEALPGIDKGEARELRVFSNKLIDKLDKISKEENWHFERTEGLFMNIRYNNGKFAASYRKLMIPLTPLHVTLAKDFADLIQICAGESPPTPVIRSAMTFLNFAIGGRHRHHFSPLVMFFEPKLHNMYGDSWDIDREGRDYLPSSLNAPVMGEPYTPDDGETSVIPGHLRLYGLQWEAPQEQGTSPLDFGHSVNDSMLSLAADPVIPIR